MMWRTSRATGKLPSGLICLYRTCFSLWFLCTSLPKHLPVSCQVNKPATSGKLA